MSSPCHPACHFTESTSLQLNCSFRWNEWVIFYLFEQRRDSCLWYLKSQDLSFLSASFFTHLYLTLLPWRFPLSEFPHASLFLLSGHSTFFPSSEFSLFVTSLATDAALLSFLRKGRQSFLPVQIYFFEPRKSSSIPASFILNSYPATEHFWLSF